MNIKSSLSSDRYLSALKNRMGGHMDWGQERFTGFFLGRCFSITHHSGYEWNRRISNVKQTAMGFVKPEGEGCRVHYIRLPGLLAPTQFWGCYLLFWVPMAAVCMVTEGLMSVALVTLILLVSMMIAAPLSVLMESIYELGDEGKLALKALLVEPGDPFYRLEHKFEL